MNESPLSIITIAKAIIEEQKISGASDNLILIKLEALGISEDLAKHLIEEMIISKFHLAEKASKRLDRLVNMLETLRTLRQLSSNYNHIDEMMNISSDKFNANYYCSNKALVLRGAIKAWPAFKKWSIDYFRHFSEIIVEVMTDRESDPHYEKNKDQHRKKFDFGSYLDLLLNAGKTNDFYMVAHNRALSGELRMLLEDCGEIAGILAPPDPELMSLFLGPEGTITSWHNDSKNVLIAQIFGRKRIHLIPYVETHLLQRGGRYAEMMDVEALNAHYPRAASATLSTIELNPGDALFLPVGWWHHIESLSVSASISCMNFCLPNHFDKN